MRCKRTKLPAPDLTMRDDMRSTHLRTERVLRLATMDGEGWPAVVPLRFVHHPDPRGDLWVWNLNRSRRTERLEAVERCAVTIDAGHDYDHLRGLSARATPVHVDDASVPLAVRGHLRAQILLLRRTARAG